MRSNTESRRLHSSEVLGQIRSALRTKQPLSIVRVGDGENVVLAQKSIWTMEKVLTSKWGKLANISRSKKGLTLPNLEMRDLMVEAIKKASIVGILDYDDEIIKAQPELKRAMTDEVFDYFGIRPRLTCSAVFCRYAARDPDFWNILRGYRIAIITRDPEPIAELLKGSPYDQQIAGTISFGHYDDLERTVDEMRDNRNRFDVALIACGVNAVVLAQQIAEETGKVAIDIGKGMTRLLLQ